MSIKAAPRYTGKYKPEDFIVPPNDSKGRGHRFSLSIHPAHNRELDIIVASRKFPFKTNADIMRWCLLRGLKILESLEAVPSVSGQVEAMMVTLGDEKDLAEYGHWVESL